MIYKKYQHIVKLPLEETNMDTNETSEENKGLLNGEVHIFSKIDGSNACVFLNDEEELCFGSRKKELTDNLDLDNFKKTILSNPDCVGLKYLLLEMPKNTVIYGEWLTPHTLKNYLADAWNHFYIFDVVFYDDDLSLDILSDDEQARRHEHYVPYDIYSKLCKKYNLNYIPELGVLNNPKLKDLVSFLDKALFLTEKGIGEGVVIKNYNYKNPYGRQTWGKIVNADFKKAKNNLRSNNTLNKQENPYEHKFISKYCTPEFISKELIKFKESAPEAFDSDGNFIMKKFGYLTNYVFEEFLTDNLILFYKENNKAVISFPSLRKLLEKEIKEKVLQ